MEESNKCSCAEAEPKYCQLIKNNTSWEWDKLKFKGQVKNNKAAQKYCIQGICSAVMAY